MIDQLKIDFVFFAYSDLPHREVMHRASLVQAAGASFVLLGPDQTMLQSARKVVAVTAARTGAGKSPLTQWLALSDLEVSPPDPGSVAGKRVLVVEDGPTVTHGGMTFGAGWVAAQKYEVAEVSDAGHG